MICGPDLHIRGQGGAGHHMARRIISLICMLSREIDSDPQVCERLRVIFLENYDVSEAEILMPAAEISEQISLAGKEASGTGCMKLMMNGAITIGTLDGANVEILEAVGKENMYIFGLSSREVDELWLRGYNSVEYYAQNEKLTKIIGQLQKGFAGESFADIASYLIASHGVSDPYMCLADFESYRLTRESMICTYADGKNGTHVALQHRLISTLRPTGQLGIMPAKSGLGRSAQKLHMLIKLTNKSAPFGC